MIGSLFAHLRPPFEETPDSSEDISPESAENSHRFAFLDSLPLVRQISLRRTAYASEAEALEISQLVALRLYKWSEKYRDRAARMSREDWDAFAARTTINEINRYLSSRSELREVGLEEAFEIECASPEGDSSCELMSLTKPLWQEICSLTLRQRRALLLHSSDLVKYLRQAEISDQDLASAIEMNVEKWKESRLRLPISDLEIAGLFRSPADLRPLSLIARAVKKARFDARKNLENARSRSGKR